MLVSEHGPALDSNLDGSGTRGKPFILADRNRRAMSHASRMETLNAGVLGDLIFNLDALSGTCPKCGELVYPEEVDASGYVK
jgi:hypothetical protein